MKKILLICWKDLVITFNDRASLILMFAAPFILTLGLGAVTGAFSPSGSSGLQDIPLALINQDEGALGDFVVQAFDAEELGEYFEPVPAVDAAEARRMVEEDQIAAAVIIPPGFTASFVPERTTGQTGPAAPVEVYANPGRPISAGTIESVLRQVLNRIETGPVSGQVTIEQLLASGRLSMDEVESYAVGMIGRMTDDGGMAASSQIGVQSEAAEAEPEEMNFLAYLAPGMAVFFLMYTVTQGGRSLLDERDRGTLPRLLSTPTHSAQVLAGKLLGVFLTGAAQVGILILAASLLFGLRWGDPWGVLGLVLAVAAAATGWGILIASLARSAFQVSSFGTAIMLFFGLLGGTFIPTSQFSEWMRLASRITPNAWAIEGFSALGSGANLADLGGEIGALLVMASVLFAVSVLVSRRRWASGFLQAG